MDANAAEEIRAAAAAAVRAIVDPKTPRYEGGRNPELGPHEKFDTQLGALRQLLSYQCVFFFPPTADQSLELLSTACLLTLS